MLYLSMHTQWQAWHWPLWNMDSILSGDLLLLADGFHLLETCWSPKQAVLCRCRWWWTRIVKGSGLRICQHPENKWEAITELPPFEKRWLFRAKNWGRWGQLCLEFQLGFSLCRKYILLNKWACVRETEIFVLNGTQLDSCLWQYLNWCLHLGSCFSPM